MTTRKIIAIGGEPGTGKTTLMRAWMKSRPQAFKHEEVAKLIPAVRFSDGLLVLGKYSDDADVFAGTDKMSMAVSPEAKEFLFRNPLVNVVFEGDRLFTASFLEYCADLTNTELTIVMVKAKDSTKQARYADRGSNQSEQFLRGRKTKYENIESSFELSPLITEFCNETYDDQAKILEFIDKSLK